MRKTYVMPLIFFGFKSSRKYDGAPLYFGEDLKMNKYTARLNIW